MNDFQLGCSYVFRGIQNFFQDRSCWKYAVFPAIPVLLIYLVFLCFVFRWTGIGAEWAASMAAGWPEWISWIAVPLQWGIWFCGVAAGFFLMAVTVSLLYELFGGLFFDALTDHYEKKTFGTTAPAVPLKQNISFTVASILFGIRSLFILLFLILISFFLPVAGQILTALVMGYFLGISCMMSSAGRNGESLAALRAAAGKRRWLTAGFGVTANLLLMFPFAALLLLPCFVVGASEMRCRELSGEQ